MSAPFSPPVSQPNAAPIAPAIAPARLATTKYRMDSHFTGEIFEFAASARTAADGVFRFVWTLAPGKRGPGEHTHPTEAETFAVVAGTLRIWQRGVPQDYRAGDVVTVAPGVPHRFLNPGTEPVVVNVGLHGTRMEDGLVPLAVDTYGRKPRFADFARMTVVMAQTWPSVPVHAWERGLVKIVAAGLRAAGVRPYHPVHGWDAT